MFDSKTKAMDIVSADVLKGAGSDDRIKFGGVYHVECFDAEGNSKWADDFHNLVVNVGLKDLNDKYFSGSSYSATWYLGLINSSATFAAGDSMTSHLGWTENVSYTQTARPTLAFGGSTTADPSVITASSVTFTINATATIGGAFVSNSSTKSGTAGILFSEGNFTGGNRAVISGDTLNVTYSFSADAA